MTDNLIGRINSFQSLGAVDGPGVRFVVFMQGCSLRCAYCHNPETWDGSQGSSYTVTEVVNKILRYKSYIQNSGGVTVSGGEPLLQWRFVAELFRNLRSLSLHTALDTSGIGDIDGARAVLEHTDLVICDLKFHNDGDYKKYCNGSLTQVLDFLDLTAEWNLPLWIRHVAVPYLTANQDDIQKIAQIAKSYPNLHKIELLPFRKICLSKYQALHLPFPLADTPELSEEQLEYLKTCLKAGISPEILG